MTPKEQGTKEKIDLIKIKTCAKDTMKRVKKNPQIGRIYLQIIDDKGLMPRI